MHPDIRQGLAAVANRRAGQAGDRKACIGPNFRSGLVSSGRSGYAARPFHPSPNHFGM